MDGFLLDEGGSQDSLPFGVCAVSSGGLVLGYTAVTDCRNDGISEVMYGLIYT